MKVVFVISLLITFVVCNPECDDVNRKKRDLTFVCNVFDGVANYIPTDYGCDQICCGKYLLSNLKHSLQNSCAHLALILNTVIYTGCFFYFLSSSI